jgi:gliding motility-associated lipoprotein GldB
MKLIRMKRYAGVCLVLITLLVTACGDDTEEQCAFIPDTDAIEINIQYESLADSFLNISSKNQLVRLLTRYPVLRDYFLQRREYPNDSVFINDLYSRFTNPHMDTLLMETRRVFGDQAELKQAFTEAFRNLKYYYPQARIPKVQTLVSGLHTDLFVSDSLIIVGLDYFLGPGAKYRPQMYDYLLKQYEKQNIVPSCMLLYGINPAYNKTNPNDKTVLADMIAYGKSYYFAKQMLPCTADSVFIWYTAEDVKGARANEDLIWYRFIEDEVLYATNHMVKQRFLGERPKTVEVGEKCPGRIGQWMGWQIVKKYMDTHADITLPQLMQNGNADQIFKESRYKPERR